MKDKDRSLYHRQGIQVLKSYQEKVGGAILRHRFLQTYLGLSCPHDPNSSDNSLVNRGCIPGTARQPSHTNGNENNAATIRLASTCMPAVAGHHNFLHPHCPPPNQQAWPRTQPEPRRYIVPSPRSTSYGASHLFVLYHYSIAALCPIHPLACSRRIPYYAFVATGTFMLHCRRPLKDFWCLISWSCCRRAGFAGLTRRILLGAFLYEGCLVS